MKCPYCNIAFNIDWYEETIQDAGNGGYLIYYELCPECNKLIIGLQHGSVFRNGSEIVGIDSDEIIYPRYRDGEMLSDAIPEKYTRLFRESEQVNYISPRASATLSRYLLQMILHEEFGIKKRNLEEEITELEAKSDVPSSLIAMLQVMRKVANFGAHPKKSTNSNEIVEIEKGESDIMLELLTELFDYQFVKPKRQQDFLKKIEKKYGITQ